MGRVIERTVKPSPSSTLDRPGWIPLEIKHGWDPDPYAYQTEEELMPGGGPHGQTLSYLTEILRHEMVARGWMLLVDTFMLYRNSYHVKHRIAPDLMFIEAQETIPRSYNLDVEPWPICVVEIISPESRTKDLVENVSLYIDDLGIPLYIVIDGVTSQGKVKDEIALHIWRSVNGQRQVVYPDPEGRYALQELGLWITTVGRRICFGDAQTNEVLYDMEQVKAVLEITEERMNEEARRAEAEAQRAEAEAQRANLAEQEAIRLAEQLRKMGIDPKSIL